MTDYQKIAEDSFLRYTVATVAKDITGKSLSIFWGCASWAAASLLSNYLFDKKESMEPNNICASLCPEETDITPYVACAFGAGVGIGMAIMYCVQRKQQPSTQITYNVQNNIQIINKKDMDINDQVIRR